MTIVPTILTAAIDDELSGKPFYQSRTLWVNVISLVAIGVQVKYGFVVGVEWQTLGLSVVNLGLRLITKKAVVLS